MNNYFWLKTIPYKYYLLIFIISGILLILLFLSFNLKVYSSFTVYGVFQKNSILIPVDLKNSDIIVKGKKIKIDNNVYQYKIEQISEIYTKDANNYQNYKIKTNLNLMENEAKKITFYYKKERLIKKIIDFIF